MRRILVLNSKGGCGKSTIATTLASWYACHDFNTVLIDHDPQGSSMRWLSLRSKTRPAIKGIDIHNSSKVNVTSSWALRVPPTTDRIIIDAPAGVTGHRINDYLNQVDTLIIPVLPSHIDMHAAANFIQDLLLIGKIRQRNIRVGVVANRVKKDAAVYVDLQCFLASLNLPFLTSLMDTQHYECAVGQGLGIHELWDQRAGTDQADWQPLFDWLENNIAPVKPKLAHGLV